MGELFRRYELKSVPKSRDALRQSLARLGKVVGAVPGCLQVIVIESRKVPGVFEFIEVWSGAEAYDAGSKTLGKEAFEEVMAAVAEPPVVAVFNVLHRNGEQSL